MASRSTGLSATRASRQRPLPGSVVAAISGAVREALRNVERHSGVSDALIMVRSAPGGVDGQVIDNGRGFTTDRVTGPSLGYHSSIMERVTDVGGPTVRHLGPGRRDHGRDHLGDIPGAQEMSRDASQRLTDLAGTWMRLITGAATPILVLAMVHG